MRAAVQAVRRLRPARVVVAVPVGARETCEALRAIADEVVCPHQLEEIAVVGQAYDSFDPLDEWYVAGLLAGR